MPGKRRWTSRRPWVYHWSKNIRTTFADHKHFAEGQWLQEDPPPSLNSALDLPYPMTSLVQFTDVEVGLKYKFF